MILVFMMVSMMTMMTMMTMLVSMAVLSRSCTSISMATLARKVESDIEMSMTRDLLICQLMPFKEIVRFNEIIYTMIYLV